MKRHILAFISGHIIDPWKILRYTWIIAVLIVVVVGVGLSWRFWGKLSSMEESPAQTIGALGIVIGGVVAILLGMWRSIEGAKQVRASEQALRNDRYQRSVELLASPVLAIRMGGIDALRRLAEEVPDQYHVQVMNQFCAFARHPTDPESDQTFAFGLPPGRLPPPWRDDVQAAITAIGIRRRKHLALEKAEDFLPDLSYADLRGIRLRGANMTGALLTGARLTGALLAETNFANAVFNHADLTGSCLTGSTLKAASFDDSDLSGVRFSLDGSGPAKELLREQLVNAAARRDSLPDFSGVIDPATKKKMEWPGRTYDPASAI